jgi:hypothetical protein
MKTTTRGAIIASAATLLLATVAHAQYAITWSSVDGGGNMFTSGGVYTLGSTIGQPDAGPLLAAAGTSMTGGFWVVASTLPPPPCPADFNHSGAVSVQDIFDFLAAYFGSDPAADFNLSGQVSVQDIFDFLAAYFAGC